MNHHIQKGSIHIIEAISVDSLMQDNVKMIRHDDYFDTRQWQRYIECEIGFILPNIQEKIIKNKNYKIIEG